MEITRGKIVGAQKIVLYGPEGIGKSTFAARFPEPVFIDTEGSTNHMDVARFPKPSSWAMLLEEVKQVKVGPAVCRTLVIDTADWAEQLCIAQVCSKAKKAGLEDFGYGKGYVFVAEEFGRLLNLLQSIVDVGVNVVITAHAKMRKFEQPDGMGAYDRWEMKLTKNVAPLVKEWADAVLFANYKTIAVAADDKGTRFKAQGGKRVMYSAHHPCWDAKNRFGLSEETPLDYEVIAPFIPSLPVPLLQNAKPPAPGSVEAAPPAPPSAPPAPPQAEKAASAPSPAAPPPELPFDQPGEIDVRGVPEALAERMTADRVRKEWIQWAVAYKGYYPAGTPIENYDPAFVEAVLVGAWDKVLELIQSNEDLPF